MTAISSLCPRFLVSMGFVLVLTCPGAAAGGESDWPHWRGPTGNGVSLDGRPPVEWGEAKNLKWKVQIPGKGSASPVVMGSRVFVSTAVPKDAGNAEKGEGRGERGESRAGRSAPDTPQQFTLLCLDRETGKVLWTRIAAEVKPLEGHHPTHGFASASPMTDGERVYAHFGSRGLFCFDLEGKEVWKKTDFGQMRTRNTFGEGSSPTIHGETILVPWDHEGPSYLVALDRKTGKTIWKTDREEPSCWATPLVVLQDGKPQVVASGEKFARGYDLATGLELWRCAGQTVRPIASPVAGHGLAFVGSGFQGNFLGAFRLDRSGDLKGTDGVVWTIDRDTPDVPSLLLSGRRLYFLGGRKGLLTCVDAVTKKPYFSGQRLEAIRDVYATPVAANGKVYLTSRDGTTVVIEDADAFRIIATNRLDEGVDATPAIAGKEIFLRGQGSLYCFTEK